MYKNISKEKEKFIVELFKKETPKEAYDFFNNNKDFINKISLFDCVSVLFSKELNNCSSWQQTGIFIHSSNGREKMILRDLIDLQYIILCEDDITAEKVYKISFLLVEKGLLCIAAEFFASACSFVPEMQEKWDELKNDSRPNLRAYIEAFSDQDANLAFMNGLLRS